jgi:glycerol-3-phosphate O-acyltransferase
MAPQGLFLEGKLTRDGTMLPMQTGMLNYLVKAYGEGNCQDIVFIPTALNYDKIPEDRTLVAHREEGFRNKGRFYSLLSFLKFFVTVGTYVLPRRHKPFGYAGVNFGTPVSLSDWQQSRQIQLADAPDDERRAGINSLGEDLALTIRDLIPVLPTNVLAHVLAASEDLPISEMELKVRALGLLRELSARGAPVVLPNNDEDYALSQGIYVLLRRKVIRPTGDGRFELVEAYRELLNYYRDTIAHLLP